MIRAVLVSRMSLLLWKRAFEDLTGRLVVWEVAHLRPAHPEISSQKILSSCSKHVDIKRGWTSKNCFPSAILFHDICPVKIFTVHLPGPARVECSLNDLWRAIRRRFCVRRCKPTA